MEMLRLFFRNLALQKNICDDLLEIHYSTSAAPTKEYDKKYGLLSCINVNHR